MTSILDFMIQDPQFSMIIGGTLTSMFVDSDSGLVYNSCIVLSGALGSLLYTKRYQTGMKLVEWYTKLEYYLTPDNEDDEDSFKVTKVDAFYIEGDKYKYQNSKNVLGSFPSEYNIFSEENPVPIGEILVTVEYNGDEYKIPFSSEYITIDNKEAYLLFDIKDMMKGRRNNVLIRNVSIKKEKSNETEMVTGCVTEEFMKYIGPTRNVYHNFIKVKASSFLVEFVEEDELDQSSIVIDCMYRGKSHKLVIKHNEHIDLTFPEINKEGYIAVSKEESEETEGSEGSDKEGWETDSDTEEDTSVSAEQEESTGESADSESKGEN